MPKEDIADLTRFLQPYPAAVRELAFWARGFVWDLYPQSNELIYDNYNTVAFGWSTSDRQMDTFCTIAMSSKYIHFGFYWGNEIADPEKRLLGNGKQYRYIVLKEKKDLPVGYIKKLLREAHANSLAKLKDNKQVITGRTIVKSISAKKRRPSAGQI